MAEVLSLGDLLMTGWEVRIGTSEVTGTLAIETGLKEVKYVFVALEEDAALAGDVVTTALSNQTNEPGEFTAKVWKRTTTDNCTPAAADAAKTVHWVAIGKGPDG